MSHGFRSKPGKRMKTKNCHGEKILKKAAMLHFCCFTINTIQGEGSSKAVPAYRLKENHAPRLSAITHRLTAIEKSALPSFLKFLPLSRQTSGRFFLKFCANVRIVFKHRTNIVQLFRV